MKKVILSIAAVLSPFCCSSSIEQSFDASVDESQASVFPDEEKQHVEIDIDSPFADNRVLVTLKAKASNPEGLPEEEIASVFGKVDYSRIQDLSKVRLNNSLEEFYSEHHFHQIYCLTLNSNSKRNVIDVCKELENNDDILTVSPDYYCEPSSFSPSDGRYGEQWGLKGGPGIDAETAWNVTRGNSKTVNVGIIDSGIYDHEDLNDNLVPGWDFYNNNEVTNDGASDHGTHVAGIVAACANGKGVVGVAPNVNIVPLQVESPFNWEGKHAMFWSTQIAAINYATGLWGTSSQISVLNRSIGFEWSVFKSSFFDCYLQVGHAIGNFPGLFVMAAGNEATNIDDGRYVSTYSKSNVLVVGAIKEDGAIASFSNYGNAVNIYAPGVNILSTIKNGYGTKEGTSMATPFVSGVAALVYSINPGLRADQVKEAILGGSVSTYLTGHNGRQFYTKRLSASGTLNYAQNHFVQTKAPLRISFASKVNSDTWNVRIQNPNTFTVYAGYNAKTCFESDAKEFKHLYDVDIVKISGNSSKYVQISKNGSADWYTVAYGYESNNNRYLKVSCTNDTRQSVSGLLIAKPVYSAEINYSSRIYGDNGIFGNTLNDSQFPYVSKEPIPLDVKITRTPGWFSSGEAKVTNDGNHSLVKVRYRTVLCFEEDAKNMVNSDIGISSIAYNGTAYYYFNSNWAADYFAVCIDCYYRGFYYSAVSYIKSDTSSTRNVNYIIWL